MFGKINCVSCILLDPGEQARDTVCSGGSSLSFQGNSLEGKKTTQRAALLIVWQLLHRWDIQQQAIFSVQENIGMVTWVCSFQLSHWVFVSYTSKLQAEWSWLFHSMEHLDIQPPRWWCSYWTLYLGIIELIFYITNKTRQEHHQLGLRFK